MPPAALGGAGRYRLGPLVQAGVVSADAPWPAAVRQRLAAVALRGRIDPGGRPPLSLTSPPCLTSLAGERRRRPSIPPGNRGLQPAARAAGCPGRRSGRLCRAGWPADGIEVAQRLGVGARQAALAVRHASLPAERLDQGLGAAQVGPWHGGEQVVLDLVVQAAEREIGEPAAAHIARGERLAAQEVALIAASRMGMPLWLGAKEHPRYRPNRPCCTIMNTTALTGGSTRNTTARSPAA